MTKVIILTPKEAERQRRIEEARDLFRRGIAGEVKSYNEIQPLKSVRDED